MSRRLLFALLSTGLTLPGLATAADLSPEQIARIRREEKAAVDKVNAAHGNKKSSEMNNAERKQVIREQQDAIQKVMDSNGVSRKDYARQTARMGPKGNDAVAAAEKAQEAQQKAAQESKPGTGEIQIQHGFGEDNPVTLEEQEGALPSVEHGLPSDEQVPTEGETDTPGAISAEPGAAQGTPPAK